MKTNDLNSKLIDSYLALLENMSPENKLSLISKLTKSTDDDSKQQNPDFYKAFGEWGKHETAEELIATIKDSRTFNRTVEEF